MADLQEEQIVLFSCDGEKFTVDRQVADESETIKNILAETGEAESIPLPNVRSTILSLVIEYCKFHVEARVKDEESGKTAKTDDEVTAWDKSFVPMDQSQLFEIILAANYLNIKSLLQITCQAVADMMTGKSPEEIRRTFNIVNDFTEDEEEEVRRQNQWAFS